MGSRLDNPHDVCANRWEIVDQRVPDSLVVGALIARSQAIPHPFDARPRDLRMPCACLLAEPCHVLPDRDDEGLRCKAGNMGVISHIPVVSAAHKPCSGVAEPYDLPQCGRVALHTGIAVVRIS